MPTAAVHAFDHAFDPAFDAWSATPGEWPIERSSLAALKDLGLSDGQVASYFRVPQENVAVLRAAYGIADQPRPVTSEPPRRRFAWGRRRRA